MISIQFSNVSLILGARALFRNISWEVQHDQKIGLIGPNGAGKSSLLKLITGEFSPEPGGNIVKARGVTVGYLPQHPEFDPQETAYNLALQGNPRMAELERRFDVLGNEDIFHDHARRPVFLDDLFQLLVNLFQALRKRLLGRGADPADPAAHSRTAQAF